MALTSRAVTAVCLLLVWTVPALAQRMNADIFYQRAMKLKKKGPLAIFSGGEVRTLVKEVKAAGHLVKKSRLDAESHGRQGRYCPPKGSKRMGSEEFLAGLGAIPDKERRSIDLAEATARLMEKKFPCSR